MMMKRMMKMKVKMRMKMKCEDVWLDKNSLFHIKRAFQEE